jgi:tRNA pseudouridine13 synthase
MIKDKPEDFVVEEVPLEFSGDGSYFIYELVKNNLSLHHCLDIISRLTSIPSKTIGYAGMKDKKAVTIQYLSFPKKVRDLKERNFSLSFKTKNVERLNLGCLKGNKFKILLRDYFGKINKNSLIPNYFDEQRFSEHNYEAGLAILRKDFKKACSLMGLNPINNNFIEALRKLPDRILRLYIHSVQSKIFNDLLADNLKSSKHKIVKYSLGEFVFPDNVKSENFQIPLPGFGFEGELPEKLKPRDFIIREIPRLSSEGASRNAFLQIKNFKTSKRKDGTLVSFELGKGSYATIVLKYCIE